MPRGQKGKPARRTRATRIRPSLPKQQSAGSGFFISGRRLHRHQHHVVADADDIQVVLKDGRELKATLVGRDRRHRPGRYKVIDPRAKGKDFPYVNFENQAKPRVGDWVITIGNPFGWAERPRRHHLGYNRDLGDTTSSSFVNYIQSTRRSIAATRAVQLRHLRPGDRRQQRHLLAVGRLGRHRLRHSGGHREATAKQLIAGGKVVRGYIGVTISTFNSEMAEALGLKDVKGAIVSELVPGGPAAKAGLLPDDILTASTARPSPTVRS